MAPVANGELDLADARHRLAKAAAEAKRLDAASAGHAAHAAWERYQLIADAIAAHERRARIARSATTG